MNPIFSLILKQLPNLLPVVESVLKNPAPATPDESRLAAMEQSLDLLAERSEYMEAKLKRLTLLIILTLLVAFAGLIIVLTR
jgi:hypothetical protein